MTPNNNLSVLPWYDSIEKQNHRRDYAFGNVFPLITPDRKLLPFQIRRPTRGNAISQVILKDITGKQIADITSQIKETGLTVKRFLSDGYDLIVYPGNLPMAIMTPEGLYYAEISDGTQRWYSEVFNIVRTVDDYMMIEWWDEEPLYYSGGHIEYDGEAFKNRVYLCTQVGKPDYDFEEEGEERDGYFFPEKQVSEKVFKFTFIAPEYLCDAMRIIRMSDHIEITSRGEKYEADSFLITPKWQEQGDLAAVEAEFETDTVIKKIGRGKLINELGDFNNSDFDTDFYDVKNTIISDITIMAKVSSIAGNMTNVSSDKPVKSNIIVNVVGSYSSGDFTILKGETVSYTPLQLGGELSDITLKSKGEGDKTNYILKIQ